MNCFRQQTCYGRGRSGPTITNVNAPNVSIVYRQPILMLFAHTVCSAEQDHLGMNPHAIKLATNCPTGHHTLSTVSNPPWFPGKNSKNNAPSTGRFPPTPKPRNENSVAAPIQVGAPPTARPKTPAMPSVALKAMRRPTISERTPQTVAPMRSPMKSAEVV
jgi:hypothetical protein